jgi:hypothetical protein
MCLPKEAYFIGGVVSNVYFSHAKDNFCSACSIVAVSLSIDELHRHMYTALDENRCFDIVIDYG